MNNKKNLQTRLDDFSNMLNSISKKHLYILHTIKKQEKRRAKLIESYKVSIPRFCIFSITWECNLNCIGCYAENYSQKRHLSDSQISFILKELGKNGTYVFIIAGGEPFTIPNLINLLNKQKNCLFVVFTNGTLITVEKIKQLRKTKSILPVLSLEGNKIDTDKRRGEDVHEIVINTMEKLKREKIPFGFSVTITHENINTVLTDKWHEQMLEKKYSLGFFIDYIPLSNDERARNLLLTDEDLIYKNSVIKKWNEKAPPYLINFPPDEYIEGKCQSAGRNLIHVNAQGFVEPCPFSHWAKDSILEKSYIDILKSGFLTEIRQKCEDLSFGKTCLLFEHKDMVEEIAIKFEAKKTDL